MTTDTGTDPSRKYVIAPWTTENTEDEDDSNLEIITVELPSRELTVQLEAPTHILDRIREESTDKDIPFTTLLGEKLEVNMANVSILAAQQTDSLTQTRDKLREAQTYLNGVTELTTEDTEQRIEETWNNKL